MSEHPEDPELIEVEREADDTANLPPGATPDSEYHESAKRNLDEARDDQPD